MATSFSERWMFGRCDRNTCFRGCSGSEVYLLYVMCCSLLPRLVGQEFISPACRWVSQRREKKVDAKATRSPSTRLTLLVTTAADCYCKYSRVLDPGRGGTRTENRRETDGTRQETLTASPFRLFVPEWLPYKMQSQWCMLQVAEDCTGGCDMHLFACLARWQQLKTDCCYNQTLVNQYCNAVFQQRHAEEWQCIVLSLLKQRNIKACT